MTRGVLVNLLMLAPAAAWLSAFLVPASHAVRSRNAFLLRRGTPRDFDWRPDAVPAGFRLERAPAPRPITDAVRALEADKLGDDWQRALALQAMLIAHARRDGRIAADLATTYRQIERGDGYCADYVRVYLAAAATAGVFCRQWAFSFDGFGGHGHTFVEIYDRDRARWKFLDVHNNVYAVTREGQAPLDALSLRRTLLVAPETIEFRQAAPGRLGYPDGRKLLAYYVRGAREWILVFGNDVAARERSGLARWLAPISGRLAHRLGSSVTGVPPLVAIVTEENRVAIAKMEALRRRVIVAIALVAGLLAAFILQWTIGAASASE
jgi:hypothetical protein